MRRSLSAGFFIAILLTLAACGVQSSKSNPGNPPPNQAPIAKLSLDRSSGPAPMTVNASTAGSNDPDGSIASISINFGDGSAAMNAASGSHTYNAAGSYTVTATVTDNGGLKATATAPVTVTTAANQPPTAKLSLDHTSGTAPLTVNASTAGSSDPDGSISSVSINFGDGSAAVNAASSSHTYNTAGNYTVTATVTDNGGLKATATAPVTVTAAGNQPPTAKLTLDHTSGTAPLTVNASTAGSSDPDGTIASTTIDFGDSSAVLNGPSASHTYNAAGNFTVTATVTDNGGLTAKATTPVSVVAAGQGFTTHGFTIPASHPRLWWTPTRIAAAKSWLTAHPFTPGSGNFADVAMKHVVAGTDCTAAVNWAASWAPSPGQVTPTASGSDDMRAGGEGPLLVYDWCYDQFTPTQRSTFISNWNTWVGNVQQQSWGGKYSGTWMSQNNYFWGNLRNELEWGIISYGDNGSGAGSTADNFIDYALNTRWSVGFLPTTQAGGAASGGVPLEGETYGSVMGAYMLVPAESLANMGRDLFAETTYFKSMMYWIIYWTTPSKTVVKDAGGISTFHVATVNEEDKMSNGGIFWCRDYFEDWMAYFAQHSATFYGIAPMSGYTRQWLSQLNPVAPLNVDPNATGQSNYYVSNYIISNDPGGTAVPYTSLPLDYYATGSGYGVSKKAWDTTSTQLTYFFRTPMSPIVGHSHDDWGSFSLWRSGRWVMRETAGYSDSIAGTPGIAGGASQDSATQLAHNVEVFTNIALGQDAGSDDMLPTVHLSLPAAKRMESTPDYFYADFDLTGAYKWDTGHSQFDTGVVGHVERELLFLRGLETTVVLDRITTQDQTHPSATLKAAQVVTSFLTHYETNPVVEDANHFTATDGTQVLRQTVLVPSSPAHRVINESGAVGQFRVEVDASGAAQRYQLHVLQARATTDSNIDATVVDSNPGSTTSGTFTVTLHPATGSDTVIVFNKGQTSSGGTINVRGAGAVNLRTDVQPVTYTDNGPVWQ